MEQHWAWDAVFYHIYPLGFCGAPARNDFQSAPTPRLEQLVGWLDHLQDVGASALYLGPLFESSAHGYDTADYYHVDRRLGNDETLRRLVQALHARGMRVILDGVFNHAGRDFWAFRDVRERGQASPYTGWFHNLRFDGPSPHSPMGDPFTYEGWNGHYDLVKLNLGNPAVREHLLGAVEMWIRDWGIDGLRLDAADCVDLGFQRELAAACRRWRPDFWLMGEIVHGDYRRWANPETLDSVTNYECYKALYSSQVDKNYWEIGYALNRQFGPGGLYRGLPLYNFADNHDVNRVASNLKNSQSLYPLYCLLFTMPGVPSIYYGSEWGIEGTRTPGSDAALRPHLDLAQTARTSRNRDLAGAIARLARVRREVAALRYGDYTQLAISMEGLVFARQTRDECVIVAVNGATSPARFEVSLPSAARGAPQIADRLNPGERFNVQAGQARIEVPPCWVRVLVADR